jgi:hypothetical protein
MFRENPGQRKNFGAAAAGEYHDFEGCGLRINGPGPDSRNDLFHQRTELVRESIEARVDAIFALGEPDDQAVLQMPQPAPE